ncbi:MAG: hypothetical protein IJP70_06925 [Bacteroidales bacterium]|nr:hypothetical protein [Bacteroidales bacterium]
MDSASKYNILAKEVADSLGIVCDTDSKQRKIISIAGSVVNMGVASFSFVLGGEQFDEKFCTDEVQLPKMAGDIPIIGILGWKFMMKYHLALDYSDFSLHTSQVDLGNLSIADCEYFFPMEIGLKNYGLPVVSLTQGDREAVAIVDTGATNNMVSTLALSDNGFHCEYLGSTDTISGFYGGLETEDVIMEFDLVTVKDDGCGAIHYKDLFKAHSNYLIKPKEGDCDENGEQLPPIETLIGCPFISKESWVLDFGVFVIYKRRY